MSFPQSDYGFNPADGYEGSIVESLLGYRTHDTGRAEVAVRFGLPVVPGTDADDYRIPNATADILAADADAWAETQTVTASDVQLTTWNGATADLGLPLKVGRKFVIATSTHADWDAVVQTMRYIGEDGLMKTEEFLGTNGGADTWITKGFGIWPISFNPGTGSGTNRTYTIGTTAEQGSLICSGIAARDKTIVQPATPNGYAIGSALAPVRVGRVLVLVETAVVKGMPAFCRLTATGSEVLGAFRHNADFADAVPVRGMTYAKSGGAASLVPVDIWI